MPCGGLLQQYLRSLCIGKRKPQEIRIKVEVHQANYLRTLPLHYSQKEVDTTDEFSVFSFNLIPAYEFMHELLSLGSRAEAPLPQYLRDKIADEIKYVAEQYSKGDDTHEDSYAVQ